MIKGLLLSGTVILIGVILLGLVAVYVRRGSQRRKWSGVAGEIVASEIREFPTLDGDLLISTDYFPVIRYVYEVNLVKYESDVVSASEPPLTVGTSEYAESKVNRYPVQKKVTVFYNPDNPREAVLENSGASLSGMLLLVILAIPFLACGLILMIGYLFMP